MSDNPLAALAMRERAAKSCDAIAGNTADFTRDHRRAAGQCASAIRALPTTFTDAELLAAAMQLPEVRALVDAADDITDAITSLNQFGDRSLTITGPTANLKWLIDTQDDALAALAPFMKGAS